MYIDDKEFLAFISQNKSTGSRGIASYNLNTNNFTQKAKNILNEEKNAKIKAMLCSDKCNMSTSLNKAFKNSTEYTEKLEKLLASVNITLVK